MATRKAKATGGDGNEVVFSFSRVGSFYGRVTFRRRKEAGFRRVGKAAKSIAWAARSSIILVLSLGKSVAVSEEVSYARQKAIVIIGVTSIVCFAVGQHARASRHVNKEGL